MCKTILNGVGVEYEENTGSKGAHSALRKTDK